MQNEPTEMQFVTQSKVGQGNMYYMGIIYATMGRGTFGVSGQQKSIVKHRILGLGKSMRCAKNLRGLLSMTYTLYDVFLHKKLTFGGHDDYNCTTIFSNIICLKPLDNKRGKVPVRTYVCSSVTLGVACSVANDVIMRMTS